MWSSTWNNLHHADRWDRAPLLRVDFLQLKSLLQLRPDQRHISAEQLLGTRIDDEREEREIPFTIWANRLQERAAAGEELTELEQKGLQLAEHLWTYQDVRMGRGLEILPSAEAHVWLPLAHLILTPFDGSTDPTGQLRKAQAAWQQARQAYRGSDAIAFQQASDRGLAALAQLGLQAADYPIAPAVCTQINLKSGFIDRPSSLWQT